MNGAPAPFMIHDLTPARSARDAAVPGGAGLA